MVTPPELGFSPAREFIRMVKEGGLLDETLFEEQVEELLPDLLLATMELGGEGGKKLEISAPDIASTVKIVPVSEVIGHSPNWPDGRGALTLSNTRINVKHPQFNGAIIISGALFNHIDHEHVLIQRDLKCKIEGGGAVAPIVKYKFVALAAEPHRKIREGLGNAAKKYSGGSRELKEFGFSILSGKSPGVRVFLEVS